MRMEVQATPQEVMRAVEAVQAFGREMGLAERDVFGLGLAVEECGSNIVNHAYSQDPLETFQLTVEHSGETLTIELRDHGPEFNPVLRPARPLSDDPLSPVGGWGIPLVRHYIDELHYSREGSENVLRLIKRLGRDNGQPESDTKNKQQ